MISPNQLFCILLLSRLSSEMVYPQSGGFSGSTLAALVVSEVLQLLFALPVILYSMRGRSVYAAASGRSRVLGIVTGYSSAFIVCYLAARTVLYTAEYAQHTLAVGMSGAVLAVLLAAFAVYAAVKGIEAISRSVLLFAVAAVILGAVTVLADIPHIELRQISKAQFSGGFISLVVERLLRGGEYLAFAALLPYISIPEKGRGSCGTALLFALCSVTLTLLVNVFSMSVLGEVYAIAEYPFTAAAGLADITFFKRLDGFTAAVWSACAGLRSALLFFSGYAMIKAALRPEAGTLPKGEAA